MTPILDPLMQYMLFAGAPAAVACLGWWLSGKFRGLERSYTQALALHENEDERRHVDNLERFARIDVRLARMQNGGGDDERRKY